MAIQLRAGWSFMPARLYVAGHSAGYIQEKPERTCRVDEIIILFIDQKP
ncbi:hypothetical protein [Marinobacter segnicrescens]